jgi:phosphatidate cytidylyltransferase
MFLAAAVLVLAAAGAVEFWRLASAAGLRPSPVLPAGAVAFPLLAASGRWDAAGTAAAALTLVAAALALAPERRAHPLGNAGADLAGAVYVGLLLAHLILLRGAFGPEAALVVLGTVWANDITAYLVGGRWGRRRLAQTVSPGKTVEGFAAGLLAAAAFAAGAGAASGSRPGQMALLGLLVALASVAGDLWESAVKRAAGVKDSGGVLPGHGGVLDRFDAVLFGVPVGYYLWGWLG